MRQKKRVSNLKINNEVEKLKIFDLSQSDIENAINDFLMINPTAKLIFISDLKIIYQYNVLLNWGAHGKK